MKKSFFSKYNDRDMKKAARDNGLTEDATEYGEFIASFDAWMTPEEQKKRAEHLQNISSKRNKKT